MAQNRPARKPARRTERRSSFRFLVTTLLTTGMVATGGFGALPDNPVTQAVQEEIGQNFSEYFLDPINAYLDLLQAPTIQPQPDSSPNPPPDLIGLFFDSPVTETAEVTVLPGTVTPPDNVQETGTPTISPTSTSTLTATATATMILTATPTFTPTRICSRPSTTPASTTFFNGSAQTIEVYLVDPTCTLTLIAALGPEQWIVQGTYIGQLWWFVDSTTTRLLADHVVSSSEEFVDVSTGAVSLSTATPVTPTSGAPFTGFTVSNVVLTDGLYQSGTSITLSPGQEFFVSYNFRVFSDPCPGCITQLITGLGSPASYGEWCAYDGVPGTFPGVAGFESAALVAPSTPGTYPVVVEYHWQYSCGDALSLYGSGGAVSPQFIGQIIVP